MVFDQTYGIVLVVLDHTGTRGPSVVRMRDLLKYIYISPYLLFLQGNLSNVHG